MTTLLLIVLVRIYVAVCLGSFGYISICRSRVPFERERVLFEKPREFALMHFEASHDFSDWFFKLFSSVARKIALGSFIDIFQSKLHRQHQQKLFSTSFQSKTFVKLKTQPNPPFIYDYSYEDIDFLRI